MSKEKATMTDEEGKARANRKRMKRLIIFFAVVEAVVIVAVVLYKFSGR